VATRALIKMKKGSRSVRGPGVTVEELVRVMWLSVKKHEQFLKSRKFKETNSLLWPLEGTQLC
jgi:hypothetical protein